MSDSKYKKLRDKWYKKLKKSGFNDIEQEDGNLKRWHSFYWRTNKTVQPKAHQAKADYYYYAEHFLNSFKFPKEMHRMVWYWHVQGLTGLEISEKLNISLSWVKILTARYAKIMRKQL